MKRITAISLVLIILLSQLAWADDYAVFGGIRGDLTLKAGVYYYSEICFISGAPVELKGTVTIPQAPDKDSYSLTIKYDLANKEAGINLTRSVKYDVTKSTDNSLDQTIINSLIPVGGLKESYKVGSDTYTLTSYQFSNTQVADTHPGIDFTSGNIMYKKVFHKNGDAFNAEAKLTLLAESQTDLSYENYWSQLNTRIIDLNIEYTPMNSDAGAWQGKVTLKFSTDKSTAFNYVRNDVQNISFRGGLLKTVNSNVVLQYNYNLPNLEGQAETTTADSTATTNEPTRLRGEGNLNTYTFEEATRLPAPKYKDTGGHWAEEAIFRMGSLEGFEPSEFFFPDNYVTREQFAMALINSIDHLTPESPEVQKSEAIKLLRPNAEPLPFDDISRQSVYYIYIEKANQEGLMLGEGNGQFLPTRQLTRQEAITIMVRALGVQDIAPAQPYNTGYRDDAQISNWAKDAIYMAREVGVVEGYPDNTARPQALMTRAEVAVLLSRFIDHLREDITIDYRDKLLNNY